MVKLLILSESLKNCISICSGFASLFAIAIAGLYFFHPRFKICIYKDKNKLKIKVENGNLYRRKIIDIKCEVTAIKSDNEPVKTVKLEKDEIIVLKKGNDESYVFYANWELKNGRSLDDYSYLRVRFLALNLLGVRKQAEGYIKIKDITDKDSCTTKNIKEYKDKNKNKNK